MVQQSLGAEGISLWRWPPIWKTGREMRSESELAAGWRPAGIARSLALHPGETGFWRLVLAFGELSCPCRLDALEKVTDSSDKMVQTRGTQQGHIPEIDVRMRET